MRNTATETLEARQFNWFRTYCLLTYKGTREEIQLPAVAAAPGADVMEGRSVSTTEM